MESEIGESAFLVPGESYVSSSTLDVQNAERMVKAYTEEEKPEMEPTEKDTNAFTNSVWSALKTAAESMRHAGAVAAAAASAANPLRFFRGKKEDFQERFEKTCQSNQSVLGAFGIQAISQRRGLHAMLFITKDIVYLWLEPDSGKIEHGLAIPIPFERIQKIRRGVVVDTQGLDVVPLAYLEDVLDEPLTEDAIQIYTPDEDAGSVHQLFGLDSSYGVCANLLDHLYTLHHPSS